MPMLEIVPSEFTPGSGEGAVLSGLAVKTNGVWFLAAASLLTAPSDVVFRSWSMWGYAQPPVPNTHGSERSGFDVGPQFTIEPFDGVRAVRVPISTADVWHQVVEGLTNGSVRLGQTCYELVARTVTPTVLLGTRGHSPAHRVVHGARRPVRGVVADIDSATPNSSEETISLARPPGLSPGPTLGAMYRERTLLHWPTELVGIEWLGSPRFDIPSKLVIGSLQQDAWIVAMMPEEDGTEIHITLGWDASRIDLLGCEVLLREEAEDLVSSEAKYRIADLPGDQRYGDPEPRSRPWDRRTLTVRLPRGTQRSAFGVTLRSPGGELLDERVVARRIESVHVSIGIAGATDETSTDVNLGDLRPSRTNVEKDADRKAGLDVHAAARAAAALRRSSITGDVGAYLRWRLSCRDDELLLLDPYLAAPEIATTLAYLGHLRRRVRALTDPPKAKNVPGAALPALPPQIEIGWLPTRATLHDRIWIVGDTGLLVGASVNGFSRAAGQTPKLFTVAELPHGDVPGIRAQFEAWWSEALSSKRLWSDWSPPVVP